MHGFFALAGVVFAGWLIVWLAVTGLVLVPNVRKRRKNVR